MKTTLTITTTTRAQRHAARIQQAQARHTNSTPAVIILNPYPSTAAQRVIDAGHAAAHFVLQARYNKSGLDLMRELEQQQPRDRQRDSLPDIARQHAEHMRAHDQHAALADALQRMADRVSTSSAEQAHAAIIARNERDTAARELAAANDLDALIANGSYSDRADIAQAAITELWRTGNFKAACKAAGQQIAAVAARNGCASNKTYVYPITAEQAAAWVARYGEDAKIPFSTREARAAGWTTVEHRNSARYPDGFYMVKHFRTAAPYVSFETWATADGAQAVAKNDGINSIMSAADAEALQALFDRANLTERERQIVRYLADNTAAKAGAQAVAEHQRQTAADIAAIMADESRTMAERRKAANRKQRAADSVTELVRREAMRANALERAGVYSADNQRKVIQRLRERLTAAAYPAEPATPEERKERQAKIWARLHANIRDNATRAAAPRVDLLGWIDSAPTSSESVITWKRRPHAVDVQTITQAQAEREEAARRERLTAHAVERAALDYRRRLMQHQPTRTAYAAHDATSAAAVFVAAWTAEDARAWYQATQAEQARKARYEAAKRATGVYSFNVDFETWRTWTADQRAEHAAFIRSLSN